MSRSNAIATALGVPTDPKHRYEQARGLVRDLEARLADARAELETARLEYQAEIGRRQQLPLPPEKDLLSVEEVAERLGVSPPVVYELVLSGEITSVRIGRRRLVRPADLRAYVDGL